MIKKYIFLINTIIFFIGSVGSTFLIMRKSVVNYDIALTFMLILGCTLAFIFLNGIKVRIDFLTTSLFLAVISIIGSLVLKYDQDLLLGFFLFIFTGFIYSLKTKAFRSNFIVRYFVGSFTYFYLKFKAFGGYIKDTSAGETIKGISFQSKDFALTGILFFVFGLPLIFIVLGLLASVNPNFANFISWDFVGKLVFGSFVFAYLSSELYLLKTIPNEKKLLFSPKVKYNLENAKILLRVIVLILIILNIFYIFFIGADLSGEINNAKNHFETSSFRSYSDYSTSRFWALIQVSIINLFLVYILTKPFKLLKNDNSKLLKPIIKFNLVLMVILSFGLIFSTLARLNLYISGYGLTEDRLYGMTFTLLLGIILILFSIGAFTKKHTKFQLASLSILITYFALMHLIPMTYFTGKVNHELYKAGAIKVFNINDILYTTTIYYEYSRGNESKEGEIEKCSNYNYTTNKQDGFFQKNKAEEYLAAIEILKDPNNKLSDLEKSCLKMDLNEIRKDSNTENNKMQGWNLMEVLARNALNENKDFLESK